MVTNCSDEHSFSIVSHQWRTKAGPGTEALLIDYCNAVLAGVRDVHLRQLQRVLNAAARLIARKRKYDSISATLRDALH